MNACDDVAGTGTYPLETYSSNGPTIDRRVKPDILGFDGVDSDIYGNTGFCGTSAAAPHVAGAAALVAAAFPAMDASQIQTFLEQHATGSGGVGAPNNPPNNASGHGVLNLGSPVVPPAPAGSTFTPLARPVRVLDTRPAPPFNGQGTLAAGQVVSLAIPSSVVPSGATAIAVNTTGVLSAGTSFLSVYPGGTAWPGTSNVNVSAPVDPVAGAFGIVPLGAGGVVNVRNNGAPTDAILDVTGYFSAVAADSTHGKYTPLPTPTRIFNSLSTPTPIVGVGQTRTVTVPVNLRPAGTTSVLVNLAAAAVHGVGYYNLSTDGTLSGSSLNFQSPDRSNLAVVALDGSGSFKIAAGGLAGAAAIVDVEGSFSETGASSFVALPSPVRIVDTRYGNGGRLGVLGAGGTTTVFGAGIFGVPYSASAIVAGLAAVDYSGNTFLTAYPAGQPLPDAANLNVSTGRIVPNGLVAGLQSHQSTIYNNRGAVDIVIDLFGYFN